MRAATKKRVQKKRPARRPHGGVTSFLESSPELAEAIAEQLRNGTPIKYACVNVGIAQETYFDWIAKAVPRDNDGVPPEARERYVKFAQIVTQARSEKIRNCLANIAEAGRIPNRATGQRDWKATAWILEKTEPDLYGLRSKLEANITIHDPREEIARLITRLSPEGGEDESDPQSEPDGG